ncbi:hypothetical protein E2320_003421, partial [Naja naja]
MGRFVVLAILLLLLPNTVGKTGSVKCIQSEPHRILHEWHKPGDIFVGGVTSHIIPLLSEITFTKVPSQDWIYLSYGSFQPTVNYDSHFSSFYRMVPNEALQLQGIVQLLLHFMWKWIGLVSIDDQSGEYFLEVLQPILSQQGICSAFIKRIPKTHPICSVEEILGKISNHISFFQNSRANVVVVYGESVTLFWLADLL